MHVCSYGRGPNPQPFRQKFGQPAACRRPNSESALAHASANSIGPREIFWLQDPKAVGGGRPSAVLMLASSPTRGSHCAGLGIQAAFAPILVPAPLLVHRNAWRGGCCSPTLADGRSRSPGQPPRRGGSGLQKEPAVARSGGSLSSAPSVSRGGSAAAGGPRCARFPPRLASARPARTSS